MTNQPIPARLADADADTDADRSILAITLNNAHDDKSTHTCQTCKNDFLQL